MKIKLKPSTAKKFFVNYCESFDRQCKFVFEYSLGETDKSDNTDYPKLLHFISQLRISRKC